MPTPETGPQNNISAEAPPSGESTDAPAETQEIRVGEQEVAEEVGGLAIDQTVETNLDEVPGRIDLNPGDRVRVYSWGGGYQDNWQYEGVDETGSKVTVTRFDSQSGDRKQRTLPSDVFSEWQREKAAQQQGQGTDLEAVGLIQAREGGGGEKPPEGPPDTGLESSPEDGGGEQNGLSQPENTATEIPELTPDLIARAKHEHLPPQTVREAIRRGYEDPIEMLVAARANEEMRQSMERLGFHLPSLASMEDPGPLPGFDQFVEQQKIGDHSRSRVAEIDDMIKNNPWKARRILKRPGFKLVRIQHIPVIGRSLTRYILAWKIYNNERSSRYDKKRFKELAWKDDLTPEEKNELKTLFAEKDKKYDDGHFGWGRKKRRLNSDLIKEFDHGVVDVKGKLGPLDRKKYRTDELPSRRESLAEEIEHLEIQQQALREKLINPSNMYVSEEARKARKAFESHPHAPDIRTRVQTLEEQRNGNVPSP